MALKNVSKFSGTIRVVMGRNRDKQRHAKLPSGDFVTTERIRIENPDGTFEYGVLKIVDTARHNFTVGKRYVIGEAHKAVKGTDIWLGKMLDPTTKQPIVTAAGTTITQERQTMMVKIDRTSNWDDSSPAEDILGGASASDDDFDAPDAIGANVGGEIAKVTPPPVVS